MTTETETRTCKYCDAVKPVLLFRSKNQCKACHADKVRQRYHENQEKVDARQRQYRQENREKLNARRRQRYRENREKVKACRRQYRRENREKVKACQRQYRQENREKLNARQRHGRLFDSNPFYRLQVIASAGKAVAA